MRIAICDDSRQQREIVRELIHSWPGRPGEVSLGEFDNGDALLQAHRAAPFDIIFLDVIMPLLNGMETARELRQTDKGVKLVFFTTSPEFAVDAFAVKASNYLLKPLKPQALWSCLDELSRELQSVQRKICIKGKHAMYQVSTADIEYIESQNKHILFVLSDGRSFLSPEPLYTYEEKLTLEDGFFKCSRGFLVNIHKIDTFAAKEIRTQSGARIPISRSCHREFEKAYFSVLFGDAGEGA